MWCNWEQIINIILGFHLVLISGFLFNNIRHLFDKKSSYWLFSSEAEGYKMLDQFQLFRKKYAEPKLSLLVFNPRQSEDFL